MLIYVIKVKLSASKVFGSGRGGCACDGQVLCRGGRGACVTVAARAAPAQGDVRYGGNSDGQGRRGQVVRDMPARSQCRTIGG